jgi:hypothetical protein
MEWTGQLSKATFVRLKTETIHILLYFATHNIDGACRTAATCQAGESRLVLVLLLLLQQQLLLPLLYSCTQCSYSSVAGNTTITAGLQTRIWNEGSLFIDGSLS